MASENDEELQLQQLLKDNPQEFVEKLTLSKITTFNLTNGTINNLPYVVEAILRNPYNRLHTLGLKHCRITIENATHIVELLSKSISLKSLMLAYSSPGILENICTVLKTNTVLENLNLNGCNITDKDIIYMADMLQINSSLTSLILADNNITAIGIKKLNIALQSNNSLTTLNLSSNNIGIEGAYHISWLLYNIYNFENNRHFLVYGKDYNTISKNNTLTSLDISRCNIGKGIEYIAYSLIHNSSLLSISLDRNNLEMDGAIILFNALLNNNVLTKLDISDNNIEMSGLGEEGIENRAIGRLAYVLQTKNNIISLILSVNNIDHHGAKLIANALKVNTSLTKLDLTINDIGSIGANYILEALSLNPDNSLDILKLDDNNIDSNIFSFISDDIIRSVSGINNIHLNNLDLYNLDLNNKSIYNNVNTINLKELSLNFNNIGIVGALRIAVGLLNNSFLPFMKTLIIPGCDIPSQGLIYISDALKYNTTLNRFNINGNNTDSISVKHFVDILKINNTLNNIVINIKPFIVETLAYIATALETNENIVLFLLRINEARGEEELVLAKKLTNDINKYTARNKHNKYVKSLSLGDIMYNNMTTDNMKYLPHYIHNVYK